MASRRRTSQFYTALGLLACFGQRRLAHENATEDSAVLSGEQRVRVSRGASIRLRWGGCGGGPPHRRIHRAYRVRNIEPNDAGPRRCGRRIRVVVLAPAARHRFSTQAVGCSGEVAGDEETAGIGNRLRQRAASGAAPAFEALAG